MNVKYLFIHFLLFASVALASNLKQTTDNKKIAVLQCYTLRPIFPIAPLIDARVFSDEFTDRANVINMMEFHSNIIPEFEKELIQVLQQQTPHDYLGGNDLYQSKGYRSLKSHVKTYPKLFQVNQSSGLLRNNTVIKNFDRVFQSSKSENFFDLKKKKTSSGQIDLRNNKEIKERMKKICEQLGVDGVIVAELRVLLTSPMPGGVIGWNFPVVTFYFYDRDMGSRIMIRKRGPAEKGYTADMRRYHLALRSYRDLLEKVVGKFAKKKL